MRKPFAPPPPEKKKYFDQGLAKKETERLQKSFPGRPITEDETGVGVFLDRTPGPPKDHKLILPALSEPGLRLPQNRSPLTLQGPDSGPAPKDTGSLPVRADQQPPQKPVNIPQPLRIPGIQLDNLQTKTGNVSQSGMVPEEQLPVQAPVTKSQFGLPQINNSVGDNSHNFAVNTMKRLGVQPTGTFDDVRSQANPQEVMAHLQRAVPEPMHQKEILEAVQEAERQTGVPAHLLLSLAKTESNFNAAAISRTGARGMFQFTRGTGRDFGLIQGDQDNRSDVRASALAAAQHLKRDAERFNGNVGLALMAYNAGPKAVARAMEQMAQGAPMEQVLPEMMEAVNGDSQKLGETMADMALSEE